MSNDKLAQALRDLLAKVRRDAPALSGKLLGDCETALAAYEAEKQAGPVAEVCKEPDYWSRGHFYKGSRHVLAAVCDLDKLPVGTKLYVSVQPVEAEQAPQYRMGRWR